MKNVKKIVVVLLSMAFTLPGMMHAQAYPINDLNLMVTQASQDLTGGKPADDVKRGLVAFTKEHQGLNRPAEKQKIYNEMLQARSRMGSQKRPSSQLTKDLVAIYIAAADWVLNGTPNQNNFVLNHELSDLAGGHQNINYVHVALSVALVNGAGRGILAPVAPVVAAVPQVMKNAAALVNGAGRGILASVAPVVAAVPQVMKNAASSVSGSVSDNIRKIFTGAAAAAVGGFAYMFSGQGDKKPQDEKKEKEERDGKEKSDGEFILPDIPHADADDSLVVSEKSDAETDSEDSGDESGADEGDDDSEDPNGDSDDESSDKEVINASTPSWINLSNLLFGTSKSSSSEGDNDPLSIPEQGGAETDADSDSNDDFGDSGDEADTDSEHGQIVEVKEIVDHSDTAQQVKKVIAQTANLQKEMANLSDEELAKKPLEWFAQPLQFVALLSNGNASENITPEMLSEGFANLRAYIATNPENKDELLQFQKLAKRFQQAWLLRKLALKAGQRDCFQDEVIVAADKMKKEVDSLTDEELAKKPVEWFAGHLQFLSLLQTQDAGNDVQVGNKDIINPKDIVDAFNRLRSFIDDETDPEKKEQLLEFQKMARQFKQAWLDRLKEEEKSKKEGAETDDENSDSDSDSESGDDAGADEGYDSLVVAAQADAETDDDCSDSDDEKSDKEDSVLPEEKAPVASSYSLNPLRFFGLLSKVKTKVETEKEIEGPGVQLSALIDRMEDKKTAAEVFDAYNAFAQALEKNTSDIVALRVAIERGDFSKLHSQLESVTVDSLDNIELKQKAKAIRSVICFTIQRLQAYGIADAKLEKLKAFETQLRHFKAVQLLPEDEKKLSELDKAFKTLARKKAACAKLGNGQPAYKAAKNEPTTKEETEKRLAAIALLEGKTETKKMYDKLVKDPSMVIGRVDK